MSDTPSASSTTPPTGSGAGPTGSGAGQGVPSGAPREPRGFSSSTTPGDRAQAALDQATSAISSGVDTATARMQDVQKWADEQHQTARMQIREHPMTAVAVTFGAGMLLGLLFARR